MLSTHDVKNDQDHSQSTSRKRPHDEDVTLNTRFDVPAFIATLKDQHIIDLFQNYIIPAIDKLEDINTDTLIRIFAGETNQGILTRMYYLLNSCAYYDFNNEYLIDIMTMFTFMNHDDEVAAMLDVLEKKMQDYVANSQARVFCHTDNDRFRFFDHDASSYKCHKVLSHCMYEWAQEIGFERKAKIIANLSPQAFLNILVTKSIFKDSAPGINADHGMWAHSLQWFCIIEQHKKTNFLQHPPLELYQQIGKSSSKIWDNFLDRLDGGAHTCPEHFSRFIIKNKNRWPLLSETIGRQRMKLGLSDDVNMVYKKHLYEKHMKEQIDGVVYRPFK